MLIVADENMPLLEESFGQFATLKKLPGRTITPEDLCDASALLVRSVTRVNEKLLRGTSINYVGTATIGTDHLDREWMDANGIINSSAPGCNADSVADWVVACLAHWSLRGDRQLMNLRAGVVGHGNVGQRVENRLNNMGITTSVSDPPKSKVMTAFSDTPLEQLTDCDIICLHAPLTIRGDHPTEKLIDHRFLSKLKDDTLVISAGRGPVLDPEAVEGELTRLNFFLDVWDPEPNVPQELLSHVEIATPHIAGYSIQSKWRGTQMLFDDFCRHHQLKAEAVPPPLLPPITDIPEQLTDWRDVIIYHYDPLKDSQRTKAALEGKKDAGSDFDRLRKEYPLRHEFSFPYLRAHHLDQSDRDQLEKVGFRFSDD